MRPEPLARLEVASEDLDPAEGDAPAWSDRVLPLLPELRNYLRRRLAANDVEDVIQEVFLRLAQRDARSAVETPKEVFLRLARRDARPAVEAPKRYLFQVARAALVDRHRRNVSRCVANHRELMETDHPSDDLSPLRILEAREEVRAARAVIAAMPERRREILIALRLEGASAKTVAARYGISTSAVEKHLARALRSLEGSAPA